MCLLTGHFVIKIRHFYYGIWRLFRQILFLSNFPAIQYAVNDDVTIVTDAPGSQETSLVHVAHVSGKYPW